jgi:hypothetical protein
MRKSLITMIAGLATTMLSSASAANGAVYQFNFESFDAKLTATGEISVNTAGQVIGVSGLIFGLANQIIRAVAVNPSFPSPAYSPNGSFIYNNLYHPSGMAFDVDGLLFVTTQNPGGYWNLWGNSPSDYSLWESAGAHNYPIEESGSLSVAAAPELSTLTMLALGLAGLGAAGRRRRTARLAESLG